MLCQLELGRSAPDEFRQFGHGSDSQAGNGEAQNMPSQYRASDDHRNRASSSRGEGVSD
jgi:hypothetical protein